MEVWEVEDRYERQLGIWNPFSPPPTPRKQILARKASLSTLFPGGLGQ